MRTGTVVIGANYGDEGKGLITDFEVRRRKANVVSRFNGGAQAGHTVRVGDRTHVFGHIGAGTFADAMTYLSSKFLVNPLVFVNELEKLKDYAPIVIANPEARVSTIFDMILNSMAEVARGANRHGSCGLGINETVTRDDAGFELRVKHLERPGLSSRLINIRKNWVPKRLKELLGEFEPTTAEEKEQFSRFHSVLNMDIKVHAENLRNAGKFLRIGAPSLPSDEHVVFEGAQGLALDEFLGEFPHVTRSMTGLPYAIIAAAELGVKQLQPLYVTRAYSTRHGAGPFKGEGKRITNKELLDTTNVHNQWQGTLRYAPLNLPLMNDNIWSDYARGKTIAEVFGIEILEPTIALTCLDQIEKSVQVLWSEADEFSPDHYILTDAESLASDIEAITGLTVTHRSYGPNCYNVRYTPNNEFGV